MSEDVVRLDLQAVYRLRLMAQSLTDQHMVAVLTAAADAWMAGDRGPLVTAVVEFADGLIAELPPSMRVFAAGGEAAARLAAEAERYEVSVQAVGGSVDEYRRLLGDGLQPEQAYQRILHEAGHPGPGPAGEWCTCTTDEVLVGIWDGVEHHQPGRTKPDPACPIHGGGQ